ncbi:hypothetical protein TRVA0_019S00408 [Trichomonascus vanleenenianus]|uniref:uncharacterized protein n=1 Tax=Trichomonascus vanleenenianus TaxID=2268995 RepID=UPI003ECAD6D4
MMIPTKLITVVSIAALANSQTFNLGIECYENKTLEACYAYPYLQTNTASGDPVFYMLAVLQDYDSCFDKFCFDGPLLKFNPSSDPAHPYSGEIGAYDAPSGLPVFNIVRNNAMAGFGTFDWYGQPHLNFNGEDNWFACGVPNPQNLPYWTIIHNGDDPTAPDGCTSIKLHIEYSPPLTSPGPTMTPL